jgi:hypothetical protein
VVGGGVGQETAKDAVAEPPAGTVTVWDALPTVQLDANPLNTTV